jgi:hypothetical protein
MRTAAFLLGVTIGVVSLHAGQVPLAFEAASLKGNKSDRDRPRETRHRIALNRFAVAGSACVRMLDARGISPSVSTCGSFIAAATSTCERLEWSTTTRIWLLSSDRTRRQSAAPAYHLIPGASSGGGESHPKCWAMNGSANITPTKITCTAIRLDRLLIPSILSSSA